MKKSRKRLLISSVAMLLVAMLALGTATFAWFSTNNTATAKNIAVKTAKQSNLLLAKNNGAFMTNVDYDHLGNNILLPASTTDYQNWYKAEADEYDSQAANDGTVEAVATAEKANYYYQEGLHIQNAGTVDVDHVTITIAFDDDTTAEYARVALVTATDKTGAIKTTFAEGESQEKYVFAPTNSRSADAIKTVNTTTKAITDTETVTASSTKSVDIGTMTPDAEKYYALFVWFEGQDTDCKDTKAGLGVPNITFTVTGTPKTT